MRHLRKHQRISIAFIKEALEQLKTTATRVATSENTADIFTKALPKRLFVQHIESMGMLFSST